LPEVPKIDTQLPGCFGGKNFLSPRSKINRDLALANMKSELSKQLDSSKIKRVQRNRFNFISTEVPAHLRLNPSQEKILNVRYHHGSPVKRSFLGDQETFMAKKLRYETECTIKNELKNHMVE
jgi:hypothetical protein